MRSIVSFIPGSSRKVRLTPREALQRPARKRRYLEVGGPPMSRIPFRIIAAAALVCLLPLGAGAATGDAALRGKVIDAYARVYSYKITVLGSVKSSGVFAAPNRYQMSTEFDGKTV